MGMEYYLVADGGGTKTEYLLFDQTGGTLAYFRTAGANATFLDRAKVMQTVRDGISGCLNRAAVSRVSGMMLFIPGFELCIDDFREDMRRPDIGLAADFWNAFYGALAMPYGIAALVGTGSFAVGVGRRGQHYIAGGWGPLFGDEGSGYHIGRLCLETVARLYDEGKGGSLLETMLLEEMGIEEVPQLRAAAYAQEFTREKIAALSLLTEKAALAGDEAAQALIARAASSLADTVTLVYNRLEEDDLTVSLTGGVVKMGALYTAPFLASLKKLAPGLTYRQPRYDPLTGAALWYFSNKLGKDIEDKALADKLAQGIARLRAIG